MEAYAITYIRLDDSDQMRANISYHFLRELAEKIGDLGLANEREVSTMKDAATFIYRILHDGTFEQGVECTDFTDDEEKMVDFFNLSKEEFLLSYSYLTEEEYDLTAKKVQERRMAK